MATAFSTLDVTRPAPGQGSGFIWDGRGHVVTSYSLVRGAAEVKVCEDSLNAVTGQWLHFGFLWDGRGHVVTSHSLVLQKSRCVGGSLGVRKLRGGTRCNARAALFGMGMWCL
mgnify:CR=1 FL=1